MGQGLNGWAKWLVGVLFTILFTAFTTLTANVIANDRDARDRDTSITESLNTNIKNQMMINQELLLKAQENKIVNQQIMATLTEIKADIKKI